MTDFNTLVAFELLGIDGLPRTVSAAEAFDDNAYLTETDFQRLCNIVCERVPGMTQRDWWEASTERRNALMEAAFATTSTPAKRAGRPRKNETDKDALIVAALVMHHQYESGSVGNHEPATGRGLAEASGNAFTNATVNRFLVSKFGKPAHKRYTAACAARRIGRLLAEWSGEQSTRHATLRDDD